MVHKMDLAQLSQFRCEVTSIGTASWPRRASGSPGIPAGGRRKRDPLDGAPQLRCKARGPLKLVSTAETVAALRRLPPVIKVSVGRAIEHFLGI